MPISKEQITTALADTPSPAGRGSLADCLEWIATCEGAVSLKFHLPSSADFDPVAITAHKAVRTLAVGEGEPLTSFTAEFVDQQGKTIATRSLGGGAPPTSAPVASPPPTPGHRPIPGLKTPDNPLARVKHIIAIGAGKGGVGKSAVAVNTAVGLARRGHAVGLLDADIYGPSLPTMLGLHSLEQSVVAGKLQPYAVHGIKAITLGKLVDPDKPLIWRGPMAHGAFTQLTDQTDWGELDYLIIDLPPGTGDIALTMAQTLKLRGAVIVCTPQQVAQDDAVRALRMFQQLNIEVLGVVENMSYFVGDDAKTYDIFGRGGAEQMAQRFGLPFLGAIPITMPLRIHSDTGEPIKNFDPAHAGDLLPRALETMTANIEAQAALAAMRTGAAGPSLSIS